MLKGKPFNEWNEEKQRLDGLVAGPYFKEREVWFTAVGVNVGHEEDGKNAKYERPVLVLKRFNKHMFFGIAFSSVLKPENKFYHTVLIRNKQSSVILSQVKTYSSKRLLRRLSILDEEQWATVNLLVREAIMPANKEHVIKTDLGEPRSSGPEGIYNSNVANISNNVKSNQRSQAGGKALHQKEFTLQDIKWFFDLMKQENMEWYIDGGWGVDVLLGEQTRRHGDLDIALPAQHSKQLRNILKTQGFTETPRSDSWEHNYVMSDGRRDIDIHTYELNEDGTNKRGVAYEARHLTGSGRLSGREFRTIPPDIMVEFHAGYEVDADDWHDVKRLCAKYTIPIPKDYEIFQRKQS